MHLFPYLLLCVLLHFSEQTFESIPSFTYTGPLEVDTEDFYFIFRHGTDVLKYQQNVFKKRMYVLIDQMFFRSSKQQSWSDEHPDDELLQLSLLNTSANYSWGPNYTALL